MQVTGIRLEALADRPNRRIDPAQVFERPLESEQLQLLLTPGLGASARVGLRLPCTTSGDGSRAAATGGDGLSRGSIRGCSGRCCDGIRNIGNRPVQALARLAHHRLVADMAGCIDAAIHVIRHRNPGPHAQQHEEKFHRRASGQRTRASLRTGPHRYSRKSPHSRLGKPHSKP